MQDFIYELMNCLWNRSLVLLLAEIPDAFCANFKWQVEVLLLDINYILYIYDADDRKYIKLY